MAVIFSELKNVNNFFFVAGIFFSYPNLLKNSLFFFKLMENVKYKVKSYDEVLIITTSCHSRVIYTFTHFPSPT